MVISTVSRQQRLFYKSAFSVRYLIFPGSQQKHPETSDKKKMVTEGRIYSQTNSPKEFIVWYFVNILDTHLLQSESLSPDWNKVPTSITTTWIRNMVQNEEEEMGVITYIWWTLGFECQAEECGVEPNLCMKWHQQGLSAQKTRARDSGMSTSIPNSDSNNQNEERDEGNILWSLYKNYQHLPMLKFPAYSISCNSNVKSEFNRIPNSNGEVYSPQRTISNFVRYRRKNDVVVYFIKLMLRLYYEKHWNASSSTQSRFHMFSYYILHYYHPGLSTLVFLPQSFTLPLYRPHSSMNTPTPFEKPNEKFHAYDVHMQRTDPTRTGYIIIAQDLL